MVSRRPDLNFTLFSGVCCVNRPHELQFGLSATTVSGQFIHRVECVGTRNDRLFPDHSVVQYLSVVEKRVKEKLPIISVLCRSISTQS